MIRRLLDGPLKGFPDLPPVWLAGFMVVAWVLDRGLPLVEAFGPLYRVLGIVLMLAALGLIGWSAWWFWRKKTTIEPHHTPSALIVEGPYRLSRNPIYLGLLALLNGLRPVAGIARPRDPALRLLPGADPALHRARGGRPQAALRGRGACLSGKDPPMALDDDACAMCAVSHSIAKA